MDSLQFLFLVTLRISILCLEKSDQKSKRMAELETKVDRCLRRCDSDLEQFGNEIELEQPGITEQLAENALNLEPQKAEAKKDYETDEDDYTVNTVKCRNRAP